MRHLQVDPELIDDTSGNINLAFPYDIFAYLRKYRLVTDQHLIQTGLSASNKFNLINKNLGRAPSIETLFEYFFTEIISPNIERNFVYQLVKLKKGHCIIRGTPSIELLETQSAHSIVGDYLTGDICLIRLGTAAGLPKILGYRDAKYRKTSCIRHGDRFCSFHIDYSQCTSQIH